jgi:anti-sigma regulatory factor (Ser/Thr protein kinase)
MTARAGREHGGMGLPVIGRLADGVTVVSDNGGTRLSMRFELSQGGVRRALFAPLQQRSMASVSH